MNTNLDFVELEASLLPARRNIETVIATGSDTAYVDWEVKDSALRALKTLRTRLTALIKVIDPYSSDES